MIDENKIVIEDIDFNHRDLLLPIMEKCFEGIYRAHAIKILKEVEIVKAAMLEGKPVGLIMLKILNNKAGYIYYFAVLPQYRNKGIAGRMLKICLNYLSEKGFNEVFVVVNETNKDSISLIKAFGFEYKIFIDLSKKYGRENASRMYHDMFVSWGELIYSKEI